MISSASSRHGQHDRFLQKLNQGINDERGRFGPEYIDREFPAIEFPTLRAICGELNTVLKTKTCTITTSRCMVPQEMSDVRLGSIVSLMD